LTTGSDFLSLYGIQQRIFNEKSKGGFLNGKTVRGF
jgi:hypothetical protein